MLVAEQLESQRGICPICRSPLSERHAVLDRFDRIGTLRPTNVRALHVNCEALVMRRRAAAWPSGAALEVAE